VIGRGGKGTRGNAKRAKKTKSNLRTGRTRSARKKAAAGRPPGVNFFISGLRQTPEHSTGQAKGENDQDERGDPQIHWFAGDLLRGEKRGAKKQ